MKRRENATCTENTLAERKMSMKISTFSLALAMAVSLLLSSSASLYAAETDDRIEAAAKQTYVFRTYLKNDDIKVSSKAGDVTLSGTVSEESHISLAKETVAIMPGVKSVDNKLKVKAGGPAAYTDAWLITKVKFTLLFHRNVNAAGTEVFSKKGNITLRGKATSLAQKDLTTEYVKDVDGVKGVMNLMTVPPAAAKKGTAVFAQKVDAMGDTVDDASVTALVKTTLLYHRSTSALNTAVETKDGVVTLRGKAKNAAEKDLATKIVSDIHGVKTVVNNMTV